MDINHVLNDLDEIRKSVTGRNLSSNWSTGLPKCQAANVGQNTQASVNVVQEITKAMGEINLTQMATGGTNFHSQKDTFFCHSFGIVSGLRNALVNVAGNKKSKEVRRGGSEVNANKTAPEVLTDDSLAFPVCEYKRMMAGFINNVNPRSFEGLDGDTFRKSKLLKQSAIMETVINRLTSKTIFETNGWKRIYGVLRFFEAFELDPENYELEAVKVTHPIAVGNRSFQDEIMADKNDGKVQTNMTGSFLETHQKTFQVKGKYKIYLYI